MEQLEDFMELQVSRLVMTCILCDFVMFVICCEYFFCEFC